jgi:hypothetical protein
MAFCCHIIYYALLSYTVIYYFFSFFIQRTGLRFFTFFSHIKKIKQTVNSCLLIKEFPEILTIQYSVYSVVAVITCFFVLKVTKHEILKTFSYHQNRHGGEGDMANVERWWAVFECSEVIWCFSLSRRWLSICIVSIDADL